MDAVVRVPLDDALSEYTPVEEQWQIKRPADSIRNKAKEVDCNEPPAGQSSFDKCGALCREGLTWRRAASEKKKVMTNSPARMGSDMISPPVMSAGLWQRLWAWST